MSKTKEIIAVMAVGAVSALIYKYALEPMVFKPVTEKIEGALK